MRFALLLLAPLVCSCGGAEPLAVAPASVLIDAAFVTQTPEDDPLPDHREGEVCKRDAWYVEDQAIEVRTGPCRYASLEAAMTAPIPAQSRMRITFVWGALDSEVPARGHVALLAGDKILAEETVDIPGPAGASVNTIVTDEPITTGTPLVFHVHNHGANTWRLHDVSVWR